MPLYKRLQRPYPGDLRYTKVRRVPMRVRKRLGLQDGVGYTDHDLDRQRYYAALERLIERETRGIELPPLAQIGFDGRAPIERFVGQMGDGDKAAPAGLRNTNSTPLDYLFFQSKTPIEFWEWAAGRRFGYDWHRARTDGPMTVDINALDMLDTDRTRLHRRLSRRSVVTFAPRKARGTKKAFSVSDSRLDAQARLGVLADAISNVSFWFLDAVIGQELTLAKVALILSVDQRYTSERFREALREAAGHYRMIPTARPRAQK